MKAGKHSPGSLLLRTGRALPFGNCGASAVSDRSQESRRQEKDRRHNLKYTLDGDAEDAKRQEQQPDQRIKHERCQGQRPAKDKQDAPEEKLDHGRTPLPQVFLNGRLISLSRCLVREPSRVGSKKASGFGNLSYSLLAFCFTFDCGLAESAFFPARMRLARSFSGMASKVLVRLGSLS